ncbi:MAG: tetraacyldisaccharide 4'-kinase [Rickettsiales bacterium]|jgi:tetraacyldisaccharide 4'-kinase|nr:tetraacyldisaccharide 4'-kinase [Rickettsiales bacterium]
MRIPKFFENENLISLLLYPLSIIYGFGRFIHVLFSIQYKSNTKIYCIGNLVVGGAGKTPLAIEIGKILKGKKVKFAYLSKGYKGTIKEFTKVKNQTSLEVGDEPLLLKEIADTYICRSRKEAIKNLELLKYDLILMDDGFQNPSIYKDKNIIVIDGNYGIGNGELLPSGPLRETIKSAFKRATFFVIIGQDRKNLTDCLVNNNFDVCSAFIETKTTPKENEKYIAFCGIGRPEKFFDTLTNNGFYLHKKYVFDDHYNYIDSDILNIILEAERENTRIITTKKDWVRINKDDRTRIDYLDIDLKFHNESEFIRLLELGK